MALELSVVVPVFNEEDNVEALHGEITSALENTGLEYEVLLIDDGSSDRTCERLRELSNLDPRLTAVRFSQNCGQTAAIQAGFDLAEGQIVVTMDGDLQNDPADIPLLMKTIGEGYDVVTGWRRDRKDRALSRRLPSIIANWLIGRVTGVRIHDNGCSLKAYRLEVIKKAHLYAEMHRFLVPMLTLSGCRIKEVVVNHRARRFGTSKYGLSRIWKVFLDLLTVKMILRFSSHPAAWFAVLAVPFVLTVLISGGASLFLYAARDSIQDFPVVVPAVTALSAFAACHLLFIGMFAELVVKAGDFRESDPVVYRVLNPQH